MRKNSFISNIRVALGALLLLALLDFGLARSARMEAFLLRYSDIAFDNPLIFHYKLAGARHAEGKRLVLVLGSSVARESVDEGIAMAALGQRAQVLNLGFFHARPVDLWMLSDALLALHPDLVVMPVHPAEAYVEYSFALTMPYYFSGQIFDLVGRKEVSAHPRDFFYARLAQFSFLFRYRETIGSALLRFGQDRLGIEPWHRRNTFRFVGEREFLPALDDRLSSFGQDFIPDTGLNVLAMSKLLSRLAAQRIPVMLMTMGNHPKLETELVRLQKTEYLAWRHDEYPAILKSWAQIPGVTVAEGPQGILAPGDYADYIHLNADGRARFSRWLGERLEKNGVLSSSPPADLH